LPRNKSGRTDYRTLSPVVNNRKEILSLIKRQKCNENKKFSIKEILYTTLRLGTRNSHRKTTPETSSASPTTGSALSQQYSFLYAEMPT
jgi:hypothetical protein